MWNTHAFMSPPSILTQCRFLFGFCVIFIYFSHHIFPSEQRSKIS